MARIVMANKSQLQAHASTKHGPIHQTCVGFCLWGFSNIKHLDHRGGMGRAGRRKERGWRKGWYKTGRQVAKAA